MHAQALAHAMETAVRENKRAGARKVMIEKRKEDAERQLAMQERKEEEDRLLQARLAEATEEERRRQERLVHLPSSLGRVVRDCLTLPCSSMGMLNVHLAVLGYGKVSPMQEMCAGLDAAPEDCSEAGFTLVDDHVAIARTCRLIAISSAWPKSLRSPSQSRGNSKKDCESPLLLTGQVSMRCATCRLKREEQRIAKEIEEREQEEARKLVEQAQKKGVKKLNIADGAPLDKATIMNQVPPSLDCIPACIV